MNILGPDVISFEAGPGGVLSAMYKGARYDNVRCVPLFPFQESARYISVLRKEEKEYTELGIIRELDLFQAPQTELVVSDVKFRYFVPEIIDIDKITSKHGLDVWMVTTDHGDKSISVRDRKENVTMADNGILFITDIDKCRYKITDYRKLPEKARLLAERKLM